MQRTEGDTWDIVSSVGRTALGVATFRAVESGRADRVVQDDYARLFVEAAGDERFNAILADPSQLGGNMFPHMVGPRTRFFDEFFEEATADGISQAVIVAAGLDSRAYRLNWSTGATVFEIDKPAVLEFKDRVLAEHAARPRAARRTVAADLREDWPAALTAAGFDPKTPTAWTAEGLLPYLPGTAADALFQRIDALSAPGSRLAAHGGPGGPDFQKFREFAQQQAERNGFGDQTPFDLWYNDKRADPMEWLAEHGWTVRGLSVTELFHSCGREIPTTPNTPPEFSALRDRITFWSAVKA
jgi:methyltransferase (TIGR00027 family)